LEKRRGEHAWVKGDQDLELLIFVRGELRVRSNRNYNGWRMGKKAYYSLLFKKEHWVGKFQCFQAPHKEERPFEGK